MPLFNLTPTGLVNTPFPHFAVPDFLPVKSEKILLDWFENTKLWSHRSEEGFYESYDMDLSAVQVPPQVEVFRADRTLRSIQKYVAKIYGVSFKSKVDIMAHWLQPGQKIGIHSDYGPVGQTHRIVIQLNRGWEVSNGGILLLFDSEDPDISSVNNRFYLPGSRSAVCFEISPYSHHAVSPINNGMRYTLVYSFYDTEGYGKFAGSSKSSVVSS